MQSRQYFWSFRNEKLRVSFAFGLFHTVVSTVIASSMLNSKWLFCSFRMKTVSFSSLDQSRWQIRGYIFCHQKLLLKFTYVLTLKTQTNLYLKPLTGSPIFIKICMPPGYVNGCIITNRSTDGTYWIPPNCWTR